MVAAAASTHWCDDWLKFTPGWLAFFWVVGTGAWQGVRKWRDYRNKRALGAAPDDLRKALTTARSRFEEIIDQGRRADWFAHEERRETGRTIEDLIGRRTDQTLREHLTEVARAWENAAVVAPPASGPWFAFEGQEETPQERAEAARVQELFARKAEKAEKGLDAIRGALTRLDELEHRTHGR